MIKKSAGLKKGRKGTPTSQWLKKMYAPNSVSPMKKYKKALAVNNSQKLE